VHVAQRAGDGRRRGRGGEGSAESGGPEEEEG
jgi:hypothetical protein